MERIYILGNSRSGTTMTARIIGNIPEYLELTEYHYFERYIDLCSSMDELTFDQGLEIVSEMLSIYYEGYISQRNSKTKYYKEAREILKSKTFDPITLHMAILDYLANKNDCLGYVEQTPNNLLHYSQVLKVEKSKMVALIRDPRFVLRSQKKKWKRSRLGAHKFSSFETVRSFLNYNPWLTALQWKINAQKLTRILDEVGPDKIFLIKFENLLNESKKTIKELCSFLQADYHDDLLNIPQIGSSYSSDEPSKKGIKATVNLPIDFSSRVISSAVRMICGRELRIYGYESRFFLDLSLISIVLYLVILPIQLLIIFALNFARTRNIFLSIKNRLKS